VLFEAAVNGGARALGVPAGITEGASADFVSLSGESAELAGRSGDALLDSMIFAGAKNSIDGVWRAGRKVVSQGRHLSRDAVVTRYRETLQRLLAQD
jgi:formimidoylglutamate deiminase